MSATETVIRVDGVSKDFQLSHEKITSIKSAFTGALKRRRLGRRKTLQHALKNINFEVKEGEFFGIVGRNGSGKSTLLKIIANIYQPTNGSIRVHGKLVPFIELGVGFNPELTGRENIYLNGAMLGFSRQQITDMYDDIVGFAELSRFMDQKLKNYSSGMQVRLAFSMAIRSEADILLIDEVLAVGDADFQRKCYAYFKRLKRSGKTVVFVSHDMTAVREYCDRAIMIEKNHIVARGTADEVASKYTRMFLEQKTGKPGSDGSASEESHRWGEGKIKYTEIGITSKPYDKNITIKCRLKSYSQREQKFSLGFRVRSGSDGGIFGVNTRLLNMKDTPIKPRETKSFVWEVPNVLASGVYSITNSIMDDESTVQDYLETEDVLEVKKEVLTGYPMQPDIKLLNVDSESQE